MANHCCPKGAWRADGRPIQAGAEPCRLCKRVIINAGLDKRVTKNGNGEVITHHVKDWVTHEDMDYRIEPKESDAHTLIPQADVVAITGTSPTNHTLEHLLELCDSTAYVVMLGDTVPLSPVLFDYGVHALSGTRVVDADLAHKCVSQGANFRQIKGTRRLTLLKG
ncbi:MAG: hypothetical protein JRJ03_19590 [Deltaproteobacteria bacterium]|nr:hypothetical protein [Deltaproteobacteria bacterium]